MHIYSLISVIVPDGELTLLALKSLTFPMHIFSLLAGNRVCKLHFPESFAYFFLNVWANEKLCRGLESENGFLPLTLGVSLALLLLLLSVTINHESNVIFLIRSHVHVLLWFPIRVTLLPL